MWTTLRASLEDSREDDDGGSYGEQAGVRQNDKCWVCRFAVVVAAVQEASAEQKQMMESDGTYQGILGNARLPSKDCDDGNCRLRPVSVFMKREKCAAG